MILSYKSEYLHKLWRAMYNIAKSGGLFEKVMAMGPEWERVKAYLRIFQDPARDPRYQTPPSENGSDPSILPPFPGLNNQPYYDPAKFGWVTRLEAAFQTLRTEGLRVGDIFVETYYGGQVQRGGRWLQGHLNAFGSRIPAQHYGEMNPQQAGDLAETLPRFCGFNGYPFGHSLYSSMEPGAHIQAHTSADNLRMRCHLPLVIPADCGIWVGGQERQWQEGKVLLLDDSFPHEAWNRSGCHRLVLILDFWHGDLTEIEINALSLFLGKKEIRHLLMPARATPKPVMEGLMQLFAWEEANGPDLSAWWPYQPESVAPIHYQKQADGKIVSV